MLPREKHLFGCTRSKPSQGSVPGWFGPNKRFGFVLNTKVGSSLVLRRPIECTRQIRSSICDCGIKPVMHIAPLGLPANYSLINF